MIINDITHTMEYVEEITRNLGCALPEKSYYIKDEGCLHATHSLPKGYAAVYIFAYETDKGCEYLKIGKANANSGPRFSSQHYGFSAQSTLAKSICNDKEFLLMGINRNNVKEWMLNNLHRINIFIKADQGKSITELVEAILHYKYHPRYEGNI